MIDLGKRLAHENSEMRLFSLAPWLQAGARGGRRGPSRSNGFPTGRPTVETVRQNFAAIFHRAKATVLMRDLEQH